MNNRTKLFTRLDAKKNRIPGSSVQRKNKPKVGDWVEEDVNVCCAPYVLLTATPADVTDDVFNVVISCSASPVLTQVVTLASATTTIQDVVDGLNSKASHLGTFQVDGSNILLKLKQDVADTLCADSANLTLAITV